MSLCLIIRGENTGNETMPGRICLQREYQESLRKQWQAGDAKHPNRRARRSSACPASDLAAASPGEGEKTFLQIHTTDSFTVAIGVQKLYCGMCGHVEVAVGSSNVCSWLCWGHCARSCAPGQHSHKLGLRQHDSPRACELIWQIQDFCFLLC